MALPTDTGVGVGEGVTVGVGVKVDVGVNVGVGVIVMVCVGVKVGPSICPGAHPINNPAKTITINKVRSFEVFMFSLFTY